MTAGNDTLEGWAGRFDAWLKDKALPLWWERGADHARGGFFDNLDQAGKPESQTKRARVQARQSWVYALSGSMGWNGDWRKGALQGLNFLFAKQQAPNGEMMMSLSADGAVQDAATLFYDQTFVLLALSEAAKIFPERPEFKRQAHALWKALAEARRHPVGGYCESAQQAFQSNPHMHLLEAALAWRAVEPGGIWDHLADEVAALGLERMFDRERGVIREYFNSDWKHQSGLAGKSVEPGHQFEWAWLLERWGLLRGHADAFAVARKLYVAGSRGVDPGRRVAMDEMSDDFAVRRATARLWPQAERLKAALALMSAAQGTDRARYGADAIAACQTLWRYLETPVAGLYRDRMTPDGGFVEEPAPATSLYHIICAIAVLKEAAGHG